MIDDVNIEIDDEALLLRWAGHHTEGQSLRYGVLATGREDEWIRYERFTDANERRFEPGSLPAARVRFRVYATDGFNTAYRDTGWIEGIRSAELDIEFDPNDPLMRHLGERGIQPRFLGAPASVDRGSQTA